MSTYATAFACCQWQVACSSSRDVCLFHQLWCLKYVQAIYCLAVCFDVIRWLLGMGPRLQLGHPAAAFCIILLTVNIASVKISAGWLVRSLIIRAADCILPKPWQASTWMLAGQHCGHACDFLLVPNCCGNQVVPLHLYCY